MTQKERLKGMIPLGYESWMAGVSKYGKQDLLRNNANWRSGIQWHQGNCCGIETALWRPYQGGDSKSWSFAWGCESWWGLITWIDNKWHYHENNAFRCCGGGCNLSQPKRLLCAWASSRLSRWNSDYQGSLEQWLSGIRVAPSHRLISCTYGISNMSSHQRVLRHYPRDWKTQFPIWRKTQKNLITNSWKLPNSLVSPSQDMRKMSTRKKTHRSNC